MILYARSVARRSATALQYGEPIPPTLADAVTRLGEAVRTMRRECRDGEDLTGTRRLVRESAELAGRAWAQGVRSFGDGVVTDLRTADSELLRATGCGPDDANRMVRTAAGAGEAETRPPPRAHLSRAVPHTPRARRRTRMARRRRARPDPFRPPTRTPRPS
ncbi:hypothetical protein [Micromonospora sp. NPDC005305]|uniref:hypothetical protein n=1 Tax=Micromonospora sp. NPDC005305 TaxID=3156875 RepID=UPI0033BB2811